MHVAYVVSQYPSLTETFVAREIARVAGMGHQVTICILRPHPAQSGAQGIEVEGVRTLRIPLHAMSLLHAHVFALRHRPRGYLRCWRDALVSVFRKPRRIHHVIYVLSAAAWFTMRLEYESVDHVRAHFLHNEAIAAMWLARLLDAPYSVTAHVVSIRHDRNLIAKAVGGSAFTVGDTQQTVSLLRQLGSAHTELIRNGVDLVQLPFVPTSFSDAHNDPSLILAVGSLVHPKGFHILIQACALLRKQRIPFKCRIVGEGYERRDLARLAHNLGVADAVDMPGTLPFRAVRELYGLATVFVMPSVPSPKGSDGLPTVLIEVMALGVPVVASNHAGIPDLVRHGATGLLVKPGDPEALAECLIELLTDSRLRGCLALNGRRLIEAEFDSRHNVAELVRLIEQSVRKA